MAIEVVGRNGAGRVIAQDRSLTGTAVLLVCEEFRTDGPGIALRPDQAPPPVVYPFPDRTDHVSLELMAESVDPQPAFEVILDLTELPSGTQKFRLDRFVAQATRQGVPGQRTTVELSETNAREWGWLTASHDDNPISGAKR